MLKNTYIGEIYQLFNEKEKRSLSGLLTLMLSLAALELIGVGSLFPYITILGQQELIHSNKYLHATSVAFSR